MVLEKKRDEDIEQVRISLVLLANGKEPVSAERLDWMAALLTRAAGAQRRIDARNRRKGGSPV